MLPSKYKIQPKCKNYFLCYILKKSPLAITLASLPNALPCLQPTFRRRTTGHCLGTFKAIHLPFPPCTLIITINVLSVSTPLLILLLFIYASGVITYLKN